MLCTLISSSGFAQIIFGIPNIGKSIINISVPTSSWIVTNEDNLFSLKPNDNGETSRLITMIWASQNPLTETALDDLVNESFDVIETLLEDITWTEDMTEFENNGILFTALDGYGFYKNEDGSKDRMSTSVMIFMPDDLNIMTLVFFGTDLAYDKWEAALLEIILSIKPAK